METAVRQVYRDPFFDRTLDDLRAKGGCAAVAADKAEEYIGILTGKGPAGGRSRFRFTRKGEYRIRNCRKVDLGGGYRIVCIQKDQRLVLLYIGTHDDCFRWIERRRTAEYDMDMIAPEAWITGSRQVWRPVNTHLLTVDGDRLSEQHEEELMSRAEDAVLRKVFAGLVRGA